MNAGRLRHEVTLQESTEVDNPSGQPVEVWSDVYTDRAEVRPLSGREGANANQITAGVTHQIALRYGGVRITPKHRIVFEGRIFNIKSALNIGERNREWKLLCEEIIEG